MSQECRPYLALQTVSPLRKQTIDPSYSKHLIMVDIILKTEKSLLSKPIKHKTIASALRLVTIQYKCLFVHI